MIFEERDILFICGFSLFVCQRGNIVYISFLVCGWKARKQKAAFFFLFFLVFKLKLLSEM